MTLDMEISYVNQKKENYLLAGAERDPEEE